MSPTKPGVKAAPKKKAAAPKKKAAVSKVEPKKAATPAVADKETVVASAKKASGSKAATKKVDAAEAEARAESLLQGFGNFQPYQPKKDEEYMNATQLTHFRLLLQSWKHALMEEVDRTVHYMQDEAANFPDPNDRASQESDFTMELRTRDRERKLIKKIEESISMLDSSDYGYCESCGIETLDEIKEKQKGG